MFEIAEPEEEIICCLMLTDAAICTSGNYERKSPHFPDVHHLLNPHTMTSPNEVTLTPSEPSISPVVTEQEAFESAPGTSTEPTADDAVHSPSSVGVEEFAEPESAPPETSDSGSTFEDDGDFFLEGPPPDFSLAKED